MDKPTSSTPTTPLPPDGTATWRLAERLFNAMGRIDPDPDCFNGFTWRELTDTKRGIFYSAIISVFGEHNDVLSAMETILPNDQQPKPVIVRTKVDLAAATRGRVKLSDGREWFTSVRVCKDGEYEVRIEDGSYLWFTRDGSGVFSGHPRPYTNIIEFEPMTYDEAVWRGLENTTSP